MIYRQCFSPKGRSIKQKKGERIGEHYPPANFGHVISHICVIIYLYVFIYVFIYIYTYICIHIYIYVFIYIYVYIYIFTCDSLSLSKYTYAHIQDYIYIYTYIYLHIYIYIAYIYPQWNVHPNRCTAFPLAVCVSFASTRFSFFAQVLFDEFIAHRSSAGCGGGKGHLTPLTWPELKSTVGWWLYKFLLPTFSRGLL